MTTNSTRLAKLALCLCAFVPLCLPAIAAEPTKASTDTVVLDLTAGSYRSFLGWKTPTLISADGKLKPLLETRHGSMKEEDRKPMPMHQSDRPPENPSTAGPSATSSGPSGSGPIGWTAVDFDEARWPRVRDGVVGLNTWAMGNTWGNGAASPPMPDPLDGNLVCLRGKFRVTDPGQVRDLKLFLRYQGGAVVYVNGAELARGHLPEGKLAPDALAARYADEAYIDSTGNARPGMSEDPKKIAELLSVRGRELKPNAFAEGVAIPGAMLRKGLNVLAIEVRAAPVHEWLVQKAPEDSKWKGNVRGRMHWLHAAVVDARVTAASGAGIAANTGPSQEIALEVTQPIETDYAWDHAHPGEKPSPMRMIGSRNGTFSGKAVLSSAGAIRNLKATASELAEAPGKGKIPASAIQVRFAERSKPGASWAPADRFDRLLAECPAEIAPVSPDRKRPAAAVAPVWYTVRVPADAPAGEYAGTLTIEAAGAAGQVRFAVPVQLKVNDWRIPDPKDFSVHNNIYSSEDSLARYYKVPMWSDKHFELIGKSMTAFQQVGNKLCTLHLAIRSPGINNSESIVRWVKKADGTFEYDFSIADRYMDLYEKTCGKPGILTVGDLDRTRGGKAPGTAGWPLLGVTVKDPATGKLEALPQPPYGTPENETFWRPVLTELRKRLEKRGWFDVTAISHDDYASPPIPEFVSTIKKIWPDGRWLQCGHPYVTTYTAADKSTMPVACVEWVWGAGSLFDPDYRGDIAYNPHKNGYPKAWAAGAPIPLANPRFRVGFVADAFRTSSSLAEHRFLMEGATQGGCRGIGRVGGDSWPLPRGQGMVHGYEGHNDHDSMFDAEIGGTGPGENVVALFSPGPDGAAFNVRTEMFREGVQVAEAIIFLQRAVADKRVGADVAKRIDDLLHERARYFLRGEYVTRAGTRMFPMEGSNWQARDDRLFALCAEVARATGK